MAEIGKMFNVSDEVIRARIHKYEIQPRSSGGRRKFNIDRDELELLYQNNSMKKIAELLGVGETIIHKRIHEHGISKPPKKKK